MEYVKTFHTIAVYMPHYLGTFSGLDVQYLFFLQGITVKRALYLLHHVNLVHTIQKVARTVRPHACHAAKENIVPMKEWKQMDYLVKKVNSILLF